MTHAAPNGLRRLRIALFLLVALGFTPHRFHLDPASRIMALASSEPATGYVAAFEVF